MKKNSKEFNEAKIQIERLDILWQEYNKIMLKAYNETEMEAKPLSGKYAKPIRTNAECLIVMKYKDGKSKSVPISKYEYMMLINTLKKYRKNNKGVMRE